MTRRQALALLAVVGILIALYLTLYKIGVIGVLSCSIGSCETVNSSKWSMLLGIPIAEWGLAAYIALFGLAIAGSAEAREQSITIARLLVALAGFSVLFSAWLTYLELFVIHAICIWCLTSALLWVVILAVSVADLRAVSRGA
ncbi:MAG TPA: vitamin K epoxide reductase family protein [Gemmatimonadaceae bacterium]